MNEAIGAVRAAKKEAERHLHTQQLTGPKQKGRFWARANEFLTKYTSLWFWLTVPYLILKQAGFTWFGAFFALLALALSAAASYGGYQLTTSLGVTPGVAILPAVFSYGTMSSCMMNVFKMAFSNQLKG